MVIARGDWVRQSAIKIVLGILIVSCCLIETTPIQVNATTQTTTKSTARVGFYRAKADASDTSSTNQGNSQHQHSTTQQAATKLPQTSVQQPTTLISWGLGLVAISLLGIKQKNRGKY